MSAETQTRPSVATRTARIITDYQSGMTYREVASIHKCTVSAVQYTLKSNKIPCNRFQLRRADRSPVLSAKHVGSYEVPLSNGGMALVDECDLPLISRYLWTESDGYAATNIKTKKVYMHRLILGLDGDESVDHKNCIRSDNRRDNLRLSSQAQNTGNTFKQPGRSSRFKGVSFCKFTGKWKATLANKQIGRFEIDEDAARAYDDAAIKKFGEFARTNFGPNPALREAK